jgi:hypothetical protein
MSCRSDLNRGLFVLVVPLSLQVSNRVAQFVTPCSKISMRRSALASAGHGERTEKPMSIEWTRVTSRAHHGMRGFIASHWVGTVDGRTVFRIEQRKPISAGRHNTRVALLFRMPSGHIGTFNNVAEAKAYAKFLEPISKLRAGVDPL